MKITIDVEIPEGFEATGEFRRAKHDEYYLYASHPLSGGTAAKKVTGFETPAVFILRRIAPKQISFYTKADDRGDITWYKQVED